MRPEYSFTNEVIVTDQTVTKHYKGSYWNPLLWALHGHRWSGPLARYDREVEMIDFLSGNPEVNVPHIIDTNRNGRTLYIRKLDMKNVRGTLEGSGDWDYKMNVLAKCAKSLKDIHSSGDRTESGNPVYHGCPVIHNFGLLGDDICVFDLEHSVRCDGVIDFAREKDLYDLTWSAVLSLAQSKSKKPNREIVGGALDAISDPSGYGSLPLPVPTFWVKYELCLDPRGPMDFELLERLTNYKT